ncbi:hypothetical protein [uncultured Bacteroides sp.]|uniref:hypothetical protein n=1 Tax=uncultured Bacteroides sp. TaxID=162156 RepID=UPI0025D9B22E|nr:hypothetical protein [uncultured Bacteroides sp.]
MKKYYCIYLFFLCLITTSCENTVLEDDVPTTSASTKSNNEDLGYYGSNFLNISIGNNERGTVRMQGDIEVYPAIGSEYLFWFNTSMTEGGVRSVVSVTGGNIIYNGRESTYLYGETKKQMVFTIRFHSSKARVNLDLEETMGYRFIDNRVSAKIAIQTRSYKGKFLPNLVNGAPYDLNVNARYVESIAGEGSLSWHWKCDNCGILNSKNDLSCKGCGKH